MKLKTSTKGCQLIVRCKTRASEVIDDKELDRFGRIFLRGFLRPRLVKKNIIDYSGPVGISLYERLKKPITKRDFLFIIEQLVVAVQKLNANNLSLANLMMELRHVYINEVTKEIQFVYVPLVGAPNKSDLIDFIESIVYSIKPDDENDNDFVSRFVYFFRALTPFDIDKIESFVEKEDRSVVNTIKKQNAGQSGFMTSNHKHYYEHYDNKNSSEDENTGILFDDVDDATGLLNDDDDATGLLNDDNATGLLNDSNDNGLHPTLFRILTEETISINKPVFRIGKERSFVDYFVADNVSVSRSHVDIITRNSSYFVKDLNSTNHTYINGQELPAQCETEIFDGDKLRLSNEDFIFNV